MGNEACIPYWKTGWASEFRGGESKPLHLGLNWLLPPPVPRPLTCTDGPCPQKLLKIPQILSTERRTHVWDDRPVLGLPEAQIPPALAKLGPSPPHLISPVAGGHRAGEM